MTNPQSPGEFVLVPREPTATDRLLDVIVWMPELSIREAIGTTYPHENDPEESFAADLAALLAALPTATPTRGELAAIIDPLPFSKDWVGHHTTRISRIEAAVAKADAILALFTRKVMA